MVHKATKVRYMKKAVVCYVQRRGQTTKSFVNNHKIVYDAMCVAPDLMKLLDEELAEVNDNVRARIYSIADAFFARYVRYYFFFYDSVSKKKSFIVGYSRRCKTGYWLANFAGMFPTLYSFMSNLLCPLGKFSMTLHLRRICHDK